MNELGQLLRETREGKDISLAQAEAQTRIRQKFIAAMEKEGIPTSAGYGQMNRDQYVQSLRINKHFQQLYSKETLDRWEKQTHCPQNEKLCAEALWFGQTMLLAEKADMDKIAEAVHKIHAHAAEIAKA